MTETILDSSSINGLLIMAQEEGLLRERETHGDKLIPSRDTLPLAEWHRQQILEQVIINSKIISGRHIPFDQLDGEFVGLDLIAVPKQMPPWPEWQNEVRAVSPEVFEGLLCARGLNLDLDKWLTLFKNTVSILDEIDAFERRTGVKVDINYSMIRGMADTTWRQSEEYMLASRYNDAYNKASPIIRATNEFLALSQYASTSRCNLKIPLYRPSANLINLPVTGYDEGELTKVFRVATRELGKMPFPNSLRQALQLANDPATLTLRAKLHEWSTSLENTSADITTKVQKEIKDASVRLIKAHNLRTAGFITGIASIPVSAVGVFDPFAGAIGLGLTCISVICDRVGKKMPDKVRWIGFGTQTWLSREDL